MTRTNEARRGLFLASVVVLAAAVGAIGAVGTVGAQDEGNGTDANASEENFYDPPADDPLNARFRDCCANTVDSVDGGVLNFNIVYGPAAGETYDVNITAPGLSDDRIDGITYGPETDLPPTDLNRTDIVGMNFTGVPAGEYEFTVSVVGEDATTTVPLEVTGEPSADEGSTTNETSANGTDEGNETMMNETEIGTENETEMANDTADDGTTMNGTANVSVVAEPSAANTSANHTVSTVVMGENATGNLTEVTVDYGESNATIGLVGGKIHSATLGGESIAGNATVPTVGPNGQNLTIGFDGSIEVSEGDRIAMTYGGMTNPPEADNYTVGVAVNNGTSANATLDVTEANESMTTTTETTEGGTETTDTTETTEETTETSATTQGTTVGGATTGGSDDGAETAGEGTATDGGGGEQTTAAGGPGFTLIAGVVALLAAAFVVARRG